MLNEDLNRGKGMNARITTRQAGDVSVVDVSGRVTMGAGSNALRDTLHELTIGGKKKIMVNLCELSYIDSSGIGELVSAYKEAKQCAGQLKLVGLSGHVVYQLLMNKSCAFFDMYVDEEVALRSFGDTTV